MCARGALHRRLDGEEVRTGTRRELPRPNANPALQQAETGLAGEWRGMAAVNAVPGERLARPRGLRLAWCSAAGPDARPTRHRWSVCRAARAGRESAARTGPPLPLHALGRCKNHGANRPDPQAAVASTRQVRPKTGKFKVVRGTPKIMC